MGKIGIDVSEHNKTLNWKGIKTDFAFFRTGFGYGDEDGQLANNIKNCKVPYGFYHFSYAYDVKTAEREADFVLSLIKEYNAKPDLPIFFDFEKEDSETYLEARGIFITKTMYSTAAKAFMDRIKKAGYKAGNYYNIDYRNRLVDKDIADRKEYYQWIAYYGDGEPISGAPNGTAPTNCDIWQYSEKGTITGFTGDLNLMVNTSLLKDKKPVQPTPKPPAKPTNINPQSRVFREGANIITNPYGGDHTGIDLVNVSGLPDDIIAHTDGEVTMCQTGRYNDPYSSGNDTYGNMLKIKCTGGYSVLYAHLASVKVKLGDRVTRGQVIGMMGDTGNSNGKHLHFEVFDRYGDRTEPEPYINADLPGGASTRPPQTVTYTPGTYKVNTDVLTVRKGAGTNFDYVSYSGLTENAKNQIQDLLGYTVNGYAKGMVCDVSEVKGNWGRTPSGWICLDYCKKV